MIGYIKAVIFFEGLTATFRPKPGANSTTFATSSPRDHNRWGRGLASGSHRRQPSTCASASCFQAVGGSTARTPPVPTSTLMVEIAATTKKSMAVPERRCMRRWSSGLRVVKLAKKRCTTKPPSHAQWNEGGSVEEGAAVGARRPHQEFDPYQAAVDQIADEDTETDNGDDGSRGLSIAAADTVWLPALGRSAGS